MEFKVVTEKNDNGGLNYESRDSNEFPLIVNCAGKVNITRPFVTSNKKGRLDYYLLYVTGGRMNVTSSLSRRFTPKLPASSPS